MRETDATIVFVKDQCVWVPETDCEKVTWSKGTPTRPNNGYLGIRYQMIAYGWEDNGNPPNIGQVGQATVIGGFSGPFIVRFGFGRIWVVNPNGGQQNLYTGFWPRIVEYFTLTPLDPEPPPTGCLVRVFVDGNQYWSRQFDIPCSEIPIEKQCPNQCPPGWHKIILDRNTGKFCCCECPPV